MDLKLLDAELTTCVGCGLCLPACPTFRVTGEEALSPRGRIAAMRAVQWDGATATDEFVHFIETCVQCRGCEPACPSGVQFGHLMEGSRAALAGAGRITPRWQRMAFAGLGHHRLVLAGSSVIAIAQRLRLVPRRFGLARIPLRRGAALRSSGTDVWMFTGCVMDAWMRTTHRATQRVIEATGTTVQIAGPGSDCCGALHIHAGLQPATRQLAERVIASMPGTAPILVNSAGCGAAMKDYGHLLGTPQAIAFSERVLDVHEWLADHLDQLPRPTGGRQTVIVQDPCHLRHVQKVHGAVRTVVGRYADLVELDDDGLCCGAGGAYSALQPELAGSVRQRKLEAIDRAGAASGAHIVISANPGCAMHLGAQGVTVRHPMDVVAEAIAATRGAPKSRR
jgi:glycolate oxidase iron-sulfur subunit